MVLGLKADVMFPLIVTETEINPSFIISSKTNVCESKRTESEKQKNFNDFMKLRMNYEEYHLMNLASEVFIIWRYWDI